MRKNKKKRKILGIAFIFEILIISVIVLVVIRKGEVSFRTIDVMEASGEIDRDGTEPAKIPTAEGTDTRPQTTKDNDSDTTPTESEDRAESGSSGRDSGASSDKEGSTNQDKNGNKEAVEIVPEDVYDTITISAAGDVTLGRDYNYGYERSFDHELKVQGNDYSYFFRNVKDLFEQDDITVVNLETTLTTAKVPAEKKFRFKADPSYVKILEEGDIETVSVANNHSHDYLDQGYEDTINTLKEAEIGYFGNGYTDIQEVRGRKVGFAGFVSWEVSKQQKEEIQKTMDKLRSDGADIVIVMFHWGIERDYYPNSVQKELARYSIDHGADLVLGCHPHVLQGIEEYNGKTIVYSLGNFCFGGNKNPSDKDSMVYVQRFNFKNDELISQEYEVIPCSISSVKDRNNYQPTPLKDKEKERVLNKLEKYSKF